jgi:flagellar biosynthesis protein FlhB
LIPSICLYIVYFFSDKVKYFFKNVYTLFIHIELSVAISFLFLYVVYVLPDVSHEIHSFIYIIKLTITSIRDRHRKQETTFRFVENLTFPLTSSPP